jgi:serine/threonine-protein kinase HipA
MKRTGAVYMHEHLAGHICHEDDEYSFTYTPEYLADSKAPPVSVTIPKRQAPYRSKMLFPFFDGLIPEGWLLNIAEENWKLDARDRMALLLTVCRDCIGAVHVEG